MPDQINRDEERSEIAEEIVVMRASMSLLSGAGPARGPRAHFGELLLHPRRPSAFLGWLPPQTDISRRKGKAWLH
jgi:hypothetical protein